MVGATGEILNHNNNSDLMHLACFNVASSHLISNACDNTLQLSGGIVVVLSKEKLKQLKDGEPVGDLDPTTLTVEGGGSQLAVSHGKLATISSSRRRVSTVYSNLT